MSEISALILGIIQGLTEFLPVSSSGHLELAEAIMGQTTEENMLMTVVLHAATALSTLVIFRKEVGEILKGLFAFKINPETQFVFKIGLSMLPAAIVGIAFEDEIEELFTQNVLLVGVMLLVTGGLLFLADRAKNTKKEVSYANAIIIGISQAIAILPGISRSGATISTSVLLGIDRERAARFSFLMVVPLILGKMAKDILGALKASEVGSDVVKASIGTMPLLVGFISAFVVGLLACKWMIALVKRSKLSWFAYYCFAVGLGAIAYKLLA